MRPTLDLVPYAWGAVCGASHLGSHLICGCEEGCCAVCLFQTGQLSSSIFYSLGRT